MPRYSTTVQREQPIAIRTVDSPRKLTKADEKRDGKQLPDRPLTFWTLSNHNIGAAQHKMEASDSDVQCVTPQKRRLQSPREVTSATHKKQQREMLCNLMLKVLHGDQASQHCSSAEAFSPQANAHRCPPLNLKSCDKATSQSSSGDEQSPRAVVPAMLREIDSAKGDRISSWPALPFVPKSLARPQVAKPQTAKTEVAPHAIKTGSSCPLRQELERELQEVRNLLRTSLRRQQRITVGNDAVTNDAVAVPTTEHPKAPIEPDPRTYSDTDVAVLDRCAGILARLGGLLRSSMGTSAPTSPTTGNAPSTLGGPSGESAMLSRKGRRGVAAAVAQSGIVELSLLQRFLRDTLPQSVIQNKKTFHDTILPRHIATDVLPSLEESKQAMEAIDSATEERLANERRHTDQKQAAWSEEKKTLVKDLHDLTELATIDDATLDGLEKRFLLLFDRHSHEHAQAQHAKQRLELIDKLKRNDKMLTSEIRSLTSNVQIAGARLHQMISMHQKLLDEKLAEEDDMRAETRGYLSEKAWVAERMESTLLRIEEEKKRTIEITREIEELKEKTKDGVVIEVGPHLTPRPAWLEKLDLVNQCKMPFPKLPPPQRSTKAGPSALGLYPSSDEDETHHGTKGKRSASSRRDTSPQGEQQDAKKASNRKKSSALGTVGSKGGGGGSFTSAIDLEPFSSASGSRAPKKAGQMQAKSFIEFVLHLRERLAVQSDFLRLSQDHAAMFKRLYQQPLDVAASVCALTQSSTVSIVPRTSIAAVAPVENVGLVLPAPQWSQHEVTQRALSLWGAVLEGVIQRGDAILAKREETSVEELLRLTCRSKPKTIEILSNQSKMANIVLGSTRASQAAPELTPFPVPQQPTKPSQPPPPAPQRRQSTTNANTAPGARPTGGGWGTSDAGQLGRVYPILNASTKEHQLLQLLYTLEKQFESFAAARGDGLGGSVASLTRRGSLGAGLMGSEAGSTKAGSPLLKSGSPTRRPAPLNLTATASSASISREPVNFLKPLVSVGVDAESQLPLNRIAVVAVASVLQLTSPVRMLEDIGDFVTEVEKAMFNASRGQAPQDSGAGGRPNIACPMSTLEIEATVCISIEGFASALKNVCDAFGFSCSAYSDIFSGGMRAAMGASVPLFLGGVVVQSADELLPTPTPTNEIIHGIAAAAANVLGRMPRQTNRAVRKDNTLTPSPSTQLAGTKGTTQDSTHEKQQERSAASDENADVADLDATQLTLTLEESLAAAEVAPSSSLNVSPLSTAQAALPVSGPIAVTLNPRQRLVGPFGDELLCSGKPWSLSVTNSTLSANRSLSASTTLAPQAKSRDPQTHMFHRLYTLGECWDAMLEALVRQLQLQQHQLHLLACKVVIENCFPSDTCQGMFLVPVRFLEQKLPQLVINPDDPLFPTFDTLMDYYTKYPIQLTKDDTTANKGGHSSSFRKAVPRSEKAARSRIAGGTGSSGGSVGGVKGEWKFVPSVIEILNRHCDLVAASEHFGAGRSTSSPLGNSTPTASAAVDPLASSTNRDRIMSVASEGNGRGSFASAIAGFGATTFYEGATALGRFLQLAVEKVEKSSKQLDHHEGFLWKPPTKKAPMDEDYFNVDDVFTILSKIQLRQHIAPVVALQ